MSASQKDKILGVLASDKSTAAPTFFGLHPGLKNSFRGLKGLRSDKEWMRKATPEQYFETFHGKGVPLKKFFDPRHPSVYVIPNHKFIQVVDDEFGEPIGFERIRFWFSSTDLYVNGDDKWVFQELMHTRPFWRLGEIPQLGYLVPPDPIELEPGTKVYYYKPAFTHTRWIHSLISAILAEIILARNGFTPAERAPVVLAVACHDIATPAGGEPTKRVDPNGLDEEKNFAFILKHYELVERWLKLFGFDLEKAVAWVENKGAIGQLLDIVDKLSYVSLDAFHLGSIFNGQMRKFCLENPLFMDVWQDIVFINKKHLAFTNPQRLFTLLLARAYEHQELLLNPDARRLDFYLTRLIKPLYLNGDITKEQLLIWGNDRLQIELEKFYAAEPEKGIMSGLITPDDYAWRKFISKEELEGFCQLIGKNNTEHTEYIAGFDTGLNWPVLAGKGKTKIVPLRERLSKKQSALLENIASSVAGYYAYWRKPTP